jgi:hypothetical protein
MTMSAELPRHGNDPEDGYSAASTDPRRRLVRRDSTASDASFFSDVEMSQDEVSALGPRKIGLSSKHGDRCSRVLPLRACQTVRHLSTTDAGQERIRQLAGLSTNRILLLNVR